MTLDDISPTNRTAGALLAPGGVVSSLALLGISLPDWVCIATLVSIAIGTLIGLVSFYWKWLDRREREEDESGVTTLAERRRQPEDE